MMCSGGTSRGISDRDAPAPNDENAAAKNARAKHTPMRGCGSAALTARPATATSVPELFKAADTVLIRAAKTAAEKNPFRPTGTS